MLGRGWGGVGVGEGLAVLVTGKNLSTTAFLALQMTRSQEVHDIVVSSGHFLPPFRKCDMGEGLRGEAERQAQASTPLPAHTLLFQPVTGEATLLSLKLHSGH